MSLLAALLATVRRCLALKFGRMSDALVACPYFCLFGMINLRSNTCVHSYTLSSVASSIVSSGWLSPCGRRLWVFFNCWLEERSVEYVLRGTRILAVRSHNIPGIMQTPSGVTPSMVAAGSEKTPGPLVVFPNSLGFGAQVEMKVTVSGSRAAVATICSRSGTTLLMIRSRF